MDGLQFELVIVGAGPSGIVAGAMLRDAGFHDFAILEKSDAVGGTWRDNKYPGLTVDIPTPYYSFSFALNADWTSLYSPRAEILDYIVKVADERGLYDRILFNSTVTKAVYDEGENLWYVHRKAGEPIVARYLIAATGFINLAKFPDIPGLKDFKGRLIHPTYWDETTTVKGENVAVIGTGATAIQLVPELAADVGRMSVFQRTPIFLLPKPDDILSDRYKWWMRNVPGAKWVIRLIIGILLDQTINAGITNYPRYRRIFQAIEKNSLKFIEQSVHDPETRKKLTPDYSWGCKRPSFSNTFYPTFNRENVELVTDRIDRVTNKGIVTSDGAQREFDTIICATGYQIYTKESVPTFPTFGRHGKELRRFWDENRYQAYRGVSVTDFPNFFVICGPYAIAHSSYIAMAEDTMKIVIRCLKKARQKSANLIEVKKEAMLRDFEFCIGRRQRLVFYAANCASSNTYYLDTHGDVPTYRPENRILVWLMSRISRMSDYDFKKHEAVSETEDTRLKQCAG